jgi:hypothetical protein
VYVTAIANAIPDMRALPKLIFGGEQYRGQVEGECQDITPEPATLEVGMTEADLSNKGLHPGSAIIVAAWISHKDKGGLTSLDLSSNNLANAGHDMSGNLLNPPA